MRRALAASKVVMRLRPDFAAEDGEVGGDLELFWGISDVYLHMSDVMFNPWSFWVDVLVEADEREVQAGRPVGEEFVLKARRSRSPPLHLRVARFGQHCEKTPPPFQRRPSSAEAMGERPILSALCAAPPANPGTVRGRVAAIIRASLGALFGLSLGAREGRSYQAR